MLKLVLDTDVIVAGLRSPSGASAALIKAARYNKIRLLASTPMVLEYEAICTLEKHMNAAGLSRAEVETFLHTLCALLEYVSPDFSWRPQLVDADDEMILETAINGQADGIVTFNLRDFGSVPETFGIHLWQPRDVIRRVQI